MIRMNLCIHMHFFDVREKQNTEYNSRVSMFAIVEVLPTKCALENVMIFCLTEK